MKYKKVTNYKVNNKSPFMDELLEVEISSRRRIIAGKSPSMIVNSDTGQVEGVQTFAVLEKVDKEQFTKIYRQGLAGMFGLSKSGVKVFSFIASIVRPNKDEVIFEMDECKKFTGYKTHAPIMTGLSELIENNFIARSNKHYRYFINPSMFFNGSRVAFIKMYQEENNIGGTMKIEPLKITGEPDPLDFIK